MMIISFQSSGIEPSSTFNNPPPVTRASRLGQLARRTSITMLSALFLSSCAGASQTPSTQPPAGDDFDRRSMDHHFETPETFAKEWNDPSRDEWQKPDEIIASLGIMPGATVVDLGAGTGYLTEFLRSAVGPDGRVLALDVAPAMVEFLKERGSKAGWDNVEVRPSTHNDPQLASTSVTAIVTLNTWHHVADRTSFAKKLYAALENEGRFVIVDFIPEPTEGHGPPLEMRLEPDAIVTELEAAGFSATVIDETLPRHYIVVGTRSSP